MGPSQSERLRESVNLFNESLRWKRFESAAKMVDPASQDHFLKDLMDAEDELFIYTMDIRSVEVKDEKDVTKKDTDDKPVPTATVRVLAESYVLPSTVLKKEFLVQTWEERHGKWYVVDGFSELLPEKKRKYYKK